MIFDMSVLEDGFDSRIVNMKLMNAGFVPMVDKLTILFLMDETSSNFENYYPSISEIAIRFFEIEVVVASTSEITSSQLLNEDNIYPLENLNNIQLSRLLDIATIVLTDTSASTTFPQSIQDKIMQINGKDNRVIVDTTATLLESEGITRKGQMNLYFNSKAGQKEQYSCPNSLN